MAFLELAAVAKIAAVGLVSAGIGAGVYFVAEEGTSDGPEDAPQVAATQAVPPTPEPLSPPEQVDRPPTATRPTATRPTATAPPAAETPAPPPERLERCPDGWQLFDNTVLHYSICYPSDWGLTRGEGPLPLASIRREDQATGFMVASPEWFPYPVGKERPDPEVMDRLNSAIRMRLDKAEPELGFGGCTPDQPLTIGDVNAVWCEDTYTINEIGQAEYGPDGSSHTVKVLAPLRNPEPIDGVDRTGWRLFIIIVSPASLYEDSTAMIWQIIHSVEVY